MLFSVTESVFLGVPVVDRDVDDAITIQAGRSAHFRSGRANRYAEH